GPFVAPARYRRRARRTGVGDRAVPRGRGPCGRCRATRRPAAPPGRACTGTGAGDGGAMNAAARVHARLRRDDEGGGAAPLSDRVAALATEEAPLLGPRQRARMVEEVLAAVAGLGPLEPLLADPAVTDVLVNGPGPGKVWVERGGVLRRMPIELTEPA